MALALLAMLGSIATAASSPVSPVPCDALGVSPNYAADHLLVCVARRIDRPDIGPTGVAFSISRDGGKSWSRKPAAGLPSSQSSWWIDVQFAPDFESTGAILVQEDTSGLWATTDLGDSFTLVDPLALGLNAHPQLAPVWIGAGASAVPALAYRGGVTDAVIHVPLAHVPNAYNPGTVLRFLHQPADDQATNLMVVAEAPGTEELGIFKCIGVTCTQQLDTIASDQHLEAAGSFVSHKQGPLGWVQTRSPFGTYVPEVRLIYPDGRVARQTQLEALMKSIAGTSLDGPQVAMALGRRGELAARITFGPGPATRPRDYFFTASTANGPWRLRATGAERTPFTPTNRLPGPGSGSRYAARSLVSAPDGRYFLLGRPNNGIEAVSGAFFCSTDSGRTWSQRCS